MKKLDFFEACKSHDWTFVYTTDTKVIAEGRNSHKKLQRVLVEHPEYLPIFKAFASCAFGEMSEPRKEDFNL